MITLRDRRYATPRVRGPLAGAFAGLAPLLALAFACLDGAVMTAADQLLAALSGAR